MNTIGLLGPKGSGKDTLAIYLAKQYGFVRTSFAEELYRQVSATYGITVETLGCRDTKETPLAFLALRYCGDPHFIEVVLQSLATSKALRKACTEYVLTGIVPKHASARRITQVMTAPRSPRLIMQLWGTEYRRKSKYGIDSYWLDIVSSHIKSNPNQQYVITDVRFINEAKFVEQLGGILIRIRRPELEAREAADRARKGTAAHPSEVELLEYQGPLEVHNKEGQLDSLSKSFDALGVLCHTKAA